MTTQESCIGGMGSVSHKHNSQIESIVRMVSSKFAKYMGFTVKRSLWNGAMNISPDGGIWYRGETPVLIVEAKFQKANANAIQRWGCDYATFRKLLPGVTYLTFATGAAAKISTGAIYRYLYPMHDGMFNTIRVGDCTTYLQEECFTLDQVVEVMENIIECL